MHPIDVFTRNVLCKLDGAIVIKPRIDGVYMPVPLFLSKLSMTTKYNTGSMYVKDISNILHAFHKEALRISADVLLYTIRKTYAITNGKPIVELSCFRLTHDALLQYPETAWVTNDNLEQEPETYDYVKMTYMDYVKDEIPKDVQSTMSLLFRVKGPGTIVVIDKRSLYTNGMSFDVVDSKITTMHRDMYAAKMMTISSSRNVYRQMVALRRNLLNDVIGYDLECGKPIDATEATALFNAYLQMAK